MLPYILLLPLLLGGDPASALLARLSPGTLTQPVTIQYFNPINYFVWTPIDGGLYWARWGVHQNETGIWSLDTTYIYRALDAVDDPDSGIHHTGTWDSFSGAGYESDLGRTEHRSDDPAGSLEFQVTGIRTLFIAIAQKPDGGYGRITINGGTTLVNGSGVENVQGDPVINFYAQTGAYNHWVETANYLDPTQTYTVQITPLGSHPPGSTGDTVYFDGYGSPCAQFTDSNGTVTNDYVKVMDAVGLDTGYAYYYRPEGATSFVFTGTDHNNEALKNVTIQNDSGQEILVDQQNPVLTSPAIRFLETGWARHPETGAVNHADVGTTLEFTCSGVKQTTLHNWTSTATVSNGYTGMMAGDSNMDRGYIAGGGNTVYDLTRDDDTEYGHLRSRMAVLYGTAHDFVIGASLPDLVGVNFWQDSTRYLYIDDKAIGTNKIYFHRTGVPLTVGSGDVWTSVVSYAIYYKPGFIPYMRPER